MQIFTYRPSSVEILSVSSRGDVPVPCEVDGKSHNHAVKAIYEWAADYLLNVGAMRRAAHRAAWAHALEDFKKRLDKGRKDPKLDLEVRTRYEEYLQVELAVLSKRPAWLLVSGDTGAGKSSLAVLLQELFNAPLFDLRSLGLRPINEMDVLIRIGFAEYFARFENGRAPRILVFDSLDKMVPGSTHRVTLQRIRALMSLVEDKVDIVILFVRASFLLTGTLGGIPNLVRVNLRPLELSSALTLAKLQGFDAEISAFVNQSEKARQLALTPLTLVMLIQVLKAGGDIRHIQDRDDLFAWITNQWLDRDNIDSIIPAATRLKCMQALALRACGSGGIPISHADINSIAQRFLAPSDVDTLEAFNTDLRVCGFLRKVNDVFEFQHAAIYEYCIARTAFEDMRTRSFEALASQPFTPEILSFLEELANKTGRKEELTGLIRDTWKADLNSTARVNLLKLYCHLNNNAADLLLDGLTIEQQNLTGVVYETLHPIRNVTFKDCNFAGSRLGKFVAVRWSLANCNFSGCQWTFVRFEHGQVNDSDFQFAPADFVSFSSTLFTGVTLLCDVRAAVSMTGGTLTDCVLGNTGSREDALSAKNQRVIRGVSMVRCTFPSPATNWRLEGCQLDDLTLAVLGAQQKSEWPSMSKDLRHAVSIWPKRPLPVTPRGVPSKSRLRKLFRGATDKKQHDS